MESQPQASLAGAATAAPANPHLKADGARPKRPNTHKCPWEGCDRWLSCPHNVEQHIREAHTKEKPYKCERCGEGFARPYSLYRHIEHVHKVKAAPGRGKGGGLERLGVERKRRKRRARKAAEGLGELEGGFDGRLVERDDMRLPENGQKPPASFVKPAFEVNNFTPQPTACLCGARFDNREALLSHLHNDHQEPHSVHCDCMLCLGMFGGRVEAAGARVDELRAARMRGLMANELFGGGGEDQVMAGAARLGIARTIDQSASRDGGVEWHLARMGWTMEQFTANMKADTDHPRAAPSYINPRSLQKSKSDAAIDNEQFKQLTTNFGRPEMAERPPLFVPYADVEPQSTATAYGGNFGMSGAAAEQASVGADICMLEVPEQLESDDLDAWLKSAEEVLGFDGGDGLL